MEFKNIQEDNNCDCITNAYQDNESTYALKTMKDFIRIQDFNSYWDKGKRPVNINDCEEVCSLKGVSVSILNESTKEDVISIYRELFPLAPKYKPYFGIVKFYESSGVVKHTPNDGNIHHYDFYKSDTFDFAKVNVIQIIELHQCLS
ncbi:hypothetical protein VR611_11010 [Aquirufa nivalisilvae]